MVLGEVTGNYSGAGLVLSSLMELPETGEVNSVNKYPLPRRAVGRVVFPSGTPDVAGSVAAGSGGVDHA